MTASAPYRRFGEYRESACDRWNAGEPVEDAFGITHGVTVEQAVGLMAAQFQFLDEAGPTIRRLEGVIEQKAIEEK